MGKWTPNYHCEVLAHKMKVLVEGACTRAKLDQRGDLPLSLSYEAFVEELDTAESFTTSLVDLLVQELADRRRRKNPDERPLISKRTADGLKWLASTPSCVHRSRPRRSTNTISDPPYGFSLSDFLTAPPDGLGIDEEDEDFGAALDGGVTATAALYDAFVRPTAGSSSGPSPISPEPQSPVERPVSSYLGALGVPTSSVWRPRSLWSTLNRGESPSGSSLTRQPSLRRPSGLPSTGGPRTTEFSSFTSRRRAEAREASVERVENSTFPQSPPTSHANRRHAFMPPWYTGEGDTDQPGTTQDPWDTYVPPSHLTLPPIRSSAGRDRPNPAEMYSAASSSSSARPRLRRGGIRAPESIHSRTAHIPSPYPRPVTVPDLDSTPREAGTQPADAATSPPSGPHAAE